MIHFLICIVRGIVDHKVTPNSLSLHDFINFDYRIIIDYQKRGLGWKFISKCSLELELCNIIYERLRNYNSSHFAYILSNVDWPNCHYTPDLYVLRNIWIVEFTHLFLKVKSLYDWRECHVPISFATLPHMPQPLLAQPLSLQIAQASPLNSHEHGSYWETLLLGWFSPQVRGNCILKACTLWLTLKTLKFCKLLCQYKVLIF